MKKLRSSSRSSPGLLGLLLAASLPTALDAAPPAWHLRPLESVPLAGVEPPVGLPVELVLDDGSAESAVGVGLGHGLQFHWFNRFSPLERPFDLREIRVLFPDDPEIDVGAAIDLVVHLDPNGDPTDGATVLRVLEETVQAADGATFSVYAIPGGVPVREPGDVLVGVVPRWIVSGVDPPVAPAALDTTSSADRSWIAVWSGDPPDPPQLPSDLFLGTVEDLQPGNWTIRAYGSRTPPIEIPTLGPRGSLLLGLLLFAVACVEIGRRRRTRP